jgi:hypothetical protein
MKLLILVLSYNDGRVFTDFMRVSQETWDKDKHPDIDVIYYSGGDISPYNITCQTVNNNSRAIRFNCSDDYNMMHWKFKLTLKEFNYHSYDHIFRTNSCSYIVKERILKIAEQLPKTNCYAGYQNGDYISGAGIFFSPDVLDILRDELTPEPHGAEDVLIGDILKDRVPMINENSRVDAGLTGVDFGVQDANSYHYRFKTSNDITGRYRDIENMRKLHEQLI